MNPSVSSKGNMFKESSRIVTELNEVNHPMGKTNFSNTEEQKCDIELVDISFQDLSYTVQVGLNPFNRKPKKLLHSIYGEFKGGEVNGILGPSGAGKSSLLNILSGFRSEGVDGTVLINRKSKNNAVFQRKSCYIMQDDHLQPLLTVQESLTFAAILKLGNKTLAGQRKSKVNRGYIYEPLNVSNSDSDENDEDFSVHPFVKLQKSMVNSVIESLNLVSLQHSLVATLSGGERKKLSIALELINNPPVMFFDEPTSGLDSSSAKQCLSILKHLAARGRTIVCTLHQPSASHLCFVDNLYCLADGRCIYFGSPNNMVSFLSSVDLNCPPYHNPADFMMEVATGEWGNHLDTLIKQILNGRSSKWKKCSNIESSETCYNSDVPIMSQADICLPVFNSLEDHHSDSEYRSSFFTQFRILLWRAFLKVSRDKFLTQTRLTLHFLIGILLGSFYYGIGRDASYVRDNFSLLFFSVLFLMFTALSSMIITFPEELPIVSREHFNGWYSLKAYYLAASVADAPTQILCCFIYCVTVYFLSSQPPEFGRFAQFFLILSTLSLLTQGIGVLVGILMDVKNGVIFGPFSVLPWVIFSGFFLHTKDAPSYFKWVFDISFLKYALEGVMLATYGYNRPVLDCHEMYCHYRMPKKLLKDLGLKEGFYWIDYSVIITLYVLVKFITYYVLRFQTNRKL